MPNQLLKPASQASGPVLIWPVPEAPTCRDADFGVVAAYIDGLPTTPSQLILLTSSAAAVSQVANALTTIPVTQAAWLHTWLETARFQAQPTQLIIFDSCITTVRRYLAELQNFGLFPTITTFRDYFLIFAQFPETPPTLA